jgi:NADPH-dependent ferric siderophore reductase
VWVAGEASAVQRIRHHLFEDRGLPSAQASVRGYCQHVRRGDADDDDDRGLRGLTTSALNCIWLNKTACMS